MDRTIVEHVRALRDLGCAVVCFVPEELRGADPDHIEDRLVEVGWDVIDALATEEDPNAPTDEDWYRAIK